MWYCYNQEAAIYLDNTPFNGESATDWGLFCSTNQTLFSWPSSTPERIQSGVVVPGFDYIENGPSQSGGGIYTYMRVSPWYGHTGPSNINNVTENPNYVNEAFCWDQSYPRNMTYLQCADFFGNINNTPQCKCGISKGF
jgi:hypothetical protein